MIEEVCEGYHTMNLPHIVWAIEVPSLFSGLSKRRTLQSCCVRTPGSPELGPVGNESSTRAARCGVHGATAIINHGLSWSEHKLRPSWSRSPLCGTIMVVRSGQVLPRSLRGPSMGTYAPKHTGPLGPTSYKHTHSADVRAREGSKRIRKKRSAATHESEAGRLVRSPNGWRPPM